MSHHNSLPIVSTLGESVLRLSRDKVTIGFLVTPWLIVLLILDALWSRFVTETTTTEILYMYVEMVPISFMAINIHRIIIIGKNAVPQYGIRRWTMRETRFLGWWIVANFYMTAMGIAVATIGLGIAGLADPKVGKVYGLILLPFAGLGMFLGWILFVRLLLLLPATAVDRREHMGWALAASKGNSIRLGILTGTLPVIYLITAVVISSITEATWAWFVIDLVYYISVVVGVAVLSVCYLHIVDSGFDEGR